MSLLCTECHQRFSHAGFTQHGRRTSNLQCREAYRQSIVEELGDIEELSDVDPTPGEDDRSVLPSGDHSGDEVWVIGDDEPMEMNHHPDFDLLDSDQQLFPADGDVGQGADYLDDNDSDTDHSDADTDELDADTDIHANEFDIGIVPELPPAEHDVADAPQDLPHPSEPNVPNGCNAPHDANVFVEPFTEGQAGAQVNDRDIPAQLYYQNKLNNPNNPFAPFGSKIDWEIASWAKTHNISAGAVDDLLGIEGVGTASDDSRWCLMLMPSGV